MDPLATSISDSADFGVIVTALGEDEVVLRLTGELDCGTAPLLRQALDELNGRRVPRLVFDLAALTFIDSSGLHEFVIALTRQQQIDGEVVLRGPSPQTIRVLEIVGLAPMFTID